jgi:MFS family permease
MAQAATAAPVADAGRNPFASARYRWWWVMTLCVSLAVGVQLVTVPTFVLARTDVKFLVALSVLCQTVPTALFTLVGGASADRFGQRRILLTTTSIGAAVSVVYVILAVMDVRQIWPVFIIAAIVGSTAAFQNPSRQSLINRLAPGSRLQNGVIWGTLAFMGGQSFLGPALGGLTVSVFGQTAGFAIEVVLLLVAGLCAARLTGIEPVVAAGHSLLSQIAAGLRYVRETPRIWQVLVLGAVPGLFFIGVATATFPIFARDTFHRGAGGIAMLNASMGAGTLIGSVLLARWGPRHNRGQWLIRSLPVGGTIMALAGLAPVLPLAMVALLAWGLTAAVFINFASTLLQSYATPAYIGRVMSIYSLCVMGTVPLGNLHAGIGVQFADARVVLVYSGAIAAALGVLAFVSLPSARSLD